MPRNTQKKAPNPRQVSGGKSQGTKKKQVVRQEHINEKRGSKQAAKTSDRVKASSFQLVVPHTKHNHGPSEQSIVRHGKQMYQNVPIVYASTQRDVVEQPCNFDTAALRLALASLVSYLINKGVVNNTTTTGFENPWEVVYGGIDYMLQSIASEIQGGTAKLSTYPRVIGDLIAALSPKTVPFMSYSNQAYSWTPFDGSALSLSNFIAKWAPVYVDPVSTNDGAYGICPRWTGSTVGLDELYSGLLRVLTGSKLHPALEIVSSDKFQSRLCKDASAFARVYVYNGLQVAPTSGYWKDVESEVTITAPTYANFCEYVTPDERAASKITIFNGGAEMAVAGRILFEQLSEFNKTPYVFKQIDFEELYTVLALWMCRAKELTIKNFIGNADGSAAKSLPFTAQQFRIALRQALIARFPSQVVGQFNAIVGDSGGNNFEPFNVMGNCGAKKDMLRFQLPTIVNENLAALEPRSLQYAGKKGSANATVYIPVWGRWKQDIPIYPMFTNGSATVPLFKIDPDEIAIDLTDGSFGEKNDFAYLNSDFYVSVMDDWNFHVSQVAEVTSDVQDMDGDGGPLGLGVLFCTRVIKTSESDSAARPKTTLRYVESLKYVSNSGLPVKEVEVPVRPPLIKGFSGPLAKPVSRVEAVPVGSIIRNGVINTTYNRKILAEEEGLYEFLILPHMRQSSKEDAITVTMYQTEVREGNAAFSSNNVSQSGAGMYSRMEQLAGLCVPGIGKNYSNLYTRTFANLQDMNRGGVLSGILAGIVGTAFPAVKGIANGIASALPF